jgi:hypothetical protein
MSFSFGNKIITDGLISYLDAANLRSYPGSGTVWNDLTINSNNGSLVNGPVYNNTYGGNITCDGGNDYIQPTGSVTSFTLSMVYQPLVFDTDPGGPGRYNCPIETNSGGGNNMFLRYGNANGSSLTLANHNIFTSQLGITVNHVVNQVYDVVITFNNSNGAVAVYSNGELKANTTFVDQLTYQGTRQLGFTFNCRYYNFKLYNRALSSTEVTQNYNALKGRFGL